ncbi:MAG: PspC domain-containing protein [candidate division KSB1 bacterium]|nr:PspC domain-containing protein [candidate division KSB1 bacterium]
MADQTRRLYRSSSHRMIAGVCGGVAEYLNTDPTVVRILWVLAALAGGVGVWMYLASWLLIPRRAEEPAAPDKQAASTGAAVGVVLILLGLWFLTRLRFPFGFFPYWHPWRGHLHSFWGWDRGIDLLPLLIILAGVAYIAYLLSAPERRGPEPKAKTEQPGPAVGAEGQAPERERFYREPEGRILAGVCSGMARHFRLDPTLVRLLWILAALLTSFVLGIIAYLVVALITPERPAQRLQPEP